MKQELGGGWQVLRTIEGGLGAVHVLFQPETQSLLAAKTFLGEVLSGDDTVERFRQESYAWINLGRHPHVVEATEYSVMQGRPYLFLEYVGGGTLDEWLGTPRLTLTKALLFGLHFCDGMQHAYEHGLKAHRDVKPANCLITTDGRLKITDFGLAKIYRDEGLKRRRKMNKWSLWVAGKLGSKAPPPKSKGAALTATGEGFGTCTHMAPEQFEDAGRVDHRADIYSFGVMLYQMLSDELPFDGVNYYSFYYQHCHTPAPELQLAELPADLAGPLKGLVARCLAKKPEQRPASFAEVRQILGEAYRRQTGETPPVPASGPAADALDLNDQGACLCRLELYEEGWRKLEKAHELDPTLVEVLVNQAVILERLGQFDKALDRLEVAKQIEPHSAVYSQLGVIVGKLGRSQEALGYLRESLRLDPTNKLAFYNMGLHLAGLGALSEAVECFDQALKLDPWMERAYLGKGMSLFNANDLVGALRCMKKSVELNPHFVDGWNYLADINITLDKIDQAQDAADKALALDPNSALAWLHQGRVLVSLQRYEEALPKLNRALVQDPESRLGWYVVGSTLSMLGRFQEALEPFERAIHLVPDDAASYYNRGVALLKLDRREDGLASLRKAQDLGSGAARQTLRQLLG